MVATLTSLTPSSGAPEITLVLSGTDFANGAVVRYTASGRTLEDSAPAYISPAELRSTVPNILDGLAGVATVVVLNPAEEASNALPFSLAAYPPVEDVYPLCSLGELKRCLGVAQEETADDERLNALIRMASWQIAGYCGRQFQVVEYTDELYDGDGTCLLAPRHTPIVDVTAIEIDGQAVNVAELKVYFAYIKFEDGESYNPRLRGYNRVFPAGAQNIKLSYSAGYVAIPGEISRACMLQVAFLRNVANRQGIASETNQVAEASTTYSEKDLAPAVRIICNRYRTTRVRTV